MVRAARRPGLTRQRENGLHVASLIERVWYSRCFVRVPLFLLAFSQTTRKYVWLHMRNIIGSQAIDSVVDLYHTSLNSIRIWIDLSDEGVPCLGLHRVEQRKR